MESVEKSKKPERTFPLFPPRLEIRAKSARISTFPQRRRRLITAQQKKNRTRLRGTDRARQEDLCSQKPLDTASLFQRWLPRQGQPLRNPRLAHQNETMGTRGTRGTQYFGLTNQGVRRGRETRGIQGNRGRGQGGRRRSIEILQERERKRERKSERD